MLHLKIEIVRAFIPGKAKLNMAARYKVFVVRPDGRRLEFPPQHDPYGHMMSEALTLGKHLENFFNGQLQYVDCKAAEFI